MLLTAGPQITQQLRHMLVDQGLAGLDFNKKTILHKQISDKFAKHKAITVHDLQWQLLDQPDVSHSQTVHEAVLIDFLKVTLTQESMKLKTRLPNLVTEFKYDLTGWKWTQRTYSLAARTKGKTDEETIQ